MPTVVLKAFVAGFLATVVAHQGVLQLLHLAGLVANPAWNLAPVPPLGIPSVLSLAFWGGLWGIVLWGLIARARPLWQWLGGALLGALLPTLVAVLVVFPLKGLATPGTIEWRLLLGGLLVNGVWGLAVVAIMRLWLPRQPRLPGAR